MATLKIDLFGSIRVFHADVEVKITKTVKALLAYLLLHRHRLHHREVLADLFWGDFPEERARNCLNTALWRLRCALEPGNIKKGTYLITSSGGEIGFNNESDHFLDLAAFEEQVPRVLKKPVRNMDAEDAHQLENTLKLYTGELLEGFYDDWALVERERLRSLFIHSLEHIMHYHRHHKNYEHAISYGQRILHQDPLREEIHRDVIRMLIGNGQRIQAMRHYETCCRILKTELGIEPMEETQALYSKIVTSPGNNKKFISDSASFKPTSQDNISLGQVFQKLDTAMKDFESLRYQLLQINQLLEKFSKYRNLPKPS